MTEDKTEFEKLMEKRKEYSDKAESRYNIDPIHTVLGRLYDMQKDFSKMSDTPEMFIEGFEQAVYNVEVMYITYSDEFSCDCELPQPVLTNDDEWYCDYCDTFLTGDLEQFI